MQLGILGSADQGFLEEQVFDLGFERKELGNVVAREKKYFRRREQSTE